MVVESAICHRDQCVSDPHPRVPRPSPAKSIEQVSYDEAVADPGLMSAALARSGFVLVTGVLAAQECELMNNGMWDAFEHVSKNMQVPISRDKESTWGTMFDLYPTSTMIFKHGKLGHTQYAWDVRQNPRVAGLFGMLYNCEPENLLTSFDAVGVSLPPEVTKRGWRPNSTDLPAAHVDQSYTNSDFKCIQSWVTANDVRPGDATLRLLPGSHRLHANAAYKFGEGSKANFVQLDAERQAWYAEHGCEPVHIVCPAGSMVFWDSRTVHAGARPLKNRPYGANIRNIVYVCMQPRDHATTAAIDKKRKLFSEQRITNHWPCEPKAESMVPHTYGKPEPLYLDPPMPFLTALGRRLAGFS
jgi:hypothetical protein